MGLYGSLIGSAICGARGGWIGVIAGAFIGSWIEEKFIRPILPRKFQRTEGAAQGFQRPGAFVHPLQREYDILGVKPSATDEEVKRAYHRLAKSFHPDVMRADGASEDKIREATARMALINEAWANVQKFTGR